MFKRLISLLICGLLLFGLCSCGEDGKYKAVKSVAEQKYSIGFRSGDQLYHYVNKALLQLSYEGVIDELSQKWFGSESAVSFPSEKDALADIGYVKHRVFIIGVDLDSYPMCFQSGDGYDGFDVELAELVCQRLGWVLKIQPIRSENAYVELNSGNIDCAWGGAVLDPESNKYAVLLTYMSNELVLAAKTTSGSSISDKTLYMGASQYYKDIMAENTKLSSKLAQISRIQGNTLDYFKALDNNECDLILTTDTAVDYANRHY